MLHHKNPRFTQLLGVAASGHGLHSPVHPPDEMAQALTLASVSSAAASCDGAGRQHFLWPRLHQFSTRARTDGARCLATVHDPSAYACEFDARQVLSLEEKPCSPNPLRRTGLYVFTTQVV